MERKTFPRGCADEKLFLVLEEIINEINQKKVSSYCVFDFEERALSIIKDIYTVIDSQTGKVDENVYNTVELKLDKARKFSDNKRNPTSQLSYAKHAIQQYGVILPPENVAAIKEKMAEAEKANNTGTYEETFKACDELDEILHKKLGLVNELMQIEKAANYCNEESPSKSAKFFSYIEKIIEAASQSAGDKLFSLLNEIRPEVFAINQRFENTARKIYKDIAK
ncbi:MAG: hypothetical protein ABII74_07165 [Elusimicrobiota bacterium]